MKDDTSLQNLCLHTHNFFCDGAEDINTLVNNAVLQGVTQIGISSHAPIKKPNKWSMDIKHLENYKLEVEKAQKTYGKQIAIFTSLEIDYIPNNSYPFDFFRKELDLDYTIGSIHLVEHPVTKALWFIDGDKNQSIENMNRIFNGDVQYAVQTFFAQTREMIRTQKPDIIGHMDKVIMNTTHLIDVSEAWYQKEIDKTLQEIKKHNVIVEANTRGIYKGKWDEPFPSYDVLKKCLDLGIPITISSDAHQSKELLLAYKEVSNNLKEIGFKHISGRHHGKWGNFPI